MTDTEGENNDEEDEDNDLGLEYDSDSDLDRRCVGCENGSRSAEVSPIKLSTGSPN